MRTRFSFLRCVPLLLALCLAVPAWAEMRHERPLGMRLGPLLALETHEGGRIGRERLRGRAAIVLFGYTSCADICPTALFDVAMNLARLGPDADRLGVYFVTVDPERDTPDRLKDYLASFDERIVGLTGTPAQIAAVTEAFLKPPAAGAGGEIADGRSHSSDIFLIDPYGMLARRVAFQDHEALHAFSRRILAQQRPTERKP